MNEKQVNPDFVEIAKLAQAELDIKYVNYGNSWLTQNEAYWKQRIKNEVDEYVKSMTIDSEKRKLLNIFNMCAMAFTTVSETRSNLYVQDKCYLCKEKLSTHDIVLDTFRCRDRLT